MKPIKFSDAEAYEPQPEWKRVSLCAEPSVGIDVFAPGRSFDFWLEKLSR